MTKIQIASDLHIEYKNDDVPNPLDFITPSAGILVLAGDIGSFYKYEQLFEFLKKLCVHFQTVLYIPGNHEFYTFPCIKPEKFDVLLDRILSIQKLIDNLHVLNSSSVRIDNICISGCTLWSKLEIDIPKYIVRIHGMNTNMYQYKHNHDLNYIKKMSEYCRNKSYKHIVITHHCPTFRTLNGSKKRKKLISLYASDLDNFLTIDNVHTWVCGHVHKNFDFITKGGTRVVGNQKGKPKDKIIDFSKKFVIEL
jgi:UDP-2,3-diacylglucosamine pyrophosphatase LpxH